jgi:hypothetical protein
MRYRVAAGALVLNAFASGGAAQVHVGPEFQVTHLFNHLYGPAVASDDSGNFVVVWAREVERNSSAVFGRRFDSTGAALGSEFQVNTYRPAPLYAPSVASDAEGRFVVVWAVYASPYWDTSGYGIVGQRYDAMGARQGGEFRVNSTTTGDQIRPAVASNASGNFVVVWHSRAGVTPSGYDSPFDVFGQRVRIGRAHQPWPHWNPSRKIRSVSAEASNPTAANTTSSPVVSTRT